MIMQSTVCDASSRAPFLALVVTRGADVVAAQAIQFRRNLNKSSSREWATHICPLPLGMRLMKGFMLEATRAISQAAWTA